jgi:hypothetical protein
MNFDLDINNYSRDELIQMFELPPKFDKNIVEIKETKLIDSINTNKDIDKNTRLKTINFLNKAKNIILDGDDNNKGKNSDTRLIDRLSNFYHENAGKLKTVDLEENTGDHMIQVRKHKPYLESDPGKYFPGTINPLKKKRQITTNIIFHISYPYPYSFEIVSIIFSLFWSSLLNFS